MVEKLMYHELRLFVSSKKIQSKKENKNQIICQNNISNILYSQNGQILNDWPNLMVASQKIITGRQTIFEITKLSKFKIGINVQYFFFPMFKF
jgi:hypothetical protein